MLIVDLLRTGGVELNSTPVVKASELVELFCVFPEIYNEQHTYINIHSYMFDLYRDPTCNLVEEISSKLPVFDCLKAYFSLIVLEQLRQGELKPVELDFDLPHHPFSVKEGSAVEFTPPFTKTLPKPLLNYTDKVKESTFWIHFFNSLRRYEDEIRNKYCDTIS